MPVQETIVETTEYRLILVLQDSRWVLAIPDANGYRLPSVAIPQWTRPAQQLQEAVLAGWRLPALIVDLLQGSPPCAVAEALAPTESTDLTPVPFEQIQVSEISEEQRVRIDALLTGDRAASSPLSHLGWMDEAITWVETETGSRLLSKRDIEQSNAGGRFALLRFHMEDGRTYWLKATGEPNAHEPSITALLSKLCGDYLPKFIASKPEWNAWLMSGDATSLKTIPIAPVELFPLLEDAVESMARLQIQTLGNGLDLLMAGAFDQGLPALRRHSKELFAYLEEAMSLQTSTKVPRLEKRRIWEIQVIFEDACSYTEDLDLPDTIVHGDLNCGNILFGSGHCQFIDWCEAYVSNPLISLQHLLLLNGVGSPETRNQINLLLKQRYLEIWATTCDPDAVARGFELMPILAAVSTLYGRGDWLTSQRRDDPRFQSYTRTLARYMDRAALALEQGESLCV
jgi:Phosphotransferase enzyme family